MRARHSPPLSCDGRQPVTTDRQKYELVAAEAFSLLVTQQYLEVSKSVNASRKDETRDAWYATQLQLAERLQAVGVPSLGEADIQAMSAAREKHHQNWLQAQGITDGNSKKKR